MTDFSLFPVWVVKQDAIALANPAHPQEGFAAMSDDKPQSVYAVLPLMGEFVAFLYRRGLG